MWWQKSKSQTLEELNEPRPLPMGRTEFENWSDRIIAAAMVPGVTKESQKAVLGERLLHVPPDKSFIADSHFVQTLRRVAVNQVGHAMFEEYRAIEKERIKREEKLNETKVLENEDVSKAGIALGGEAKEVRVH